MNKLGFIIFIYNLLTISNAANAYASDATDPCGQCGPDKQECDKQPWAVLKGGLYWAWASPCSGKCGKLVSPIPYGWRQATDDEFYNIGPPAESEFGCKDIRQGAYCWDPDACSAWIFDPNMGYCNIGSTFVHTNNGGRDDTVLVHDECDECPEYILIEDGTSRTYAEAVNYCDKVHGGLASITTQDEFDCARSLISNSAAWIGLNALSNDAAIYSYRDGTQCPYDWSGYKFDGCVYPPWWQYKGKNNGDPGRPRCPHNYNDENGSECANINKSYIDNDIQCDVSLGAVLCNVIKILPPK